MRDPLRRKGQLEGTIVGYSFKKPDKQLTNAKTDRYSRKSEILVYANEEQTKIKTPVKPAPLITLVVNNKKVPLKDHGGRQPRNKGKKIPYHQIIRSFADLKMA